MQALIFDLDGTLWDSVIPVVDAWNRVLETRYPGLRPPITYDEQRGLMGLTMDLLGQRLFPMLPPDQCKETLDVCCEEECRYLTEHGATLYPELEPTLAALAAQYRLMIVSNCQEGYIESFLAAHHMEPYFCDIQCYGNNFLPKGDNIRIIMERNHIQDAVYIGDTQGDCDASAAAGVPFVFARYGFGQADRYDAVIDTPSQLLTLPLLQTR
jgi:phosphoglycolate phosphatase